MSRVFSSKKSSVVTQRQFHDFSYKQGCRVATRSSGTLTTDFEDGILVDGIQLATGNRILIKDQTVPTENGIYTVNSSGTPTRAEDFNDNAEVDNGAFIFVSEGNHNGDRSFVLSHGDSPVKLGITPLNFHEITSIPENNSVTTKKIHDLAVTTAKINTDAVTTAKILDANVTTDKIANDAVTTVKIADANVTNGKLANNAVSIHKIANYAGGEITEPAQQVLAYNASGVGWFNVANVCFLEGTKITLPNHKIKNIEDLTLEDEILTYNIEGLSEIRNKNIISQWSNNNMKGEFSKSGIRNIWINPTDSYLEINGKLNVTKHHLIHFRRGNRGGKDCDKDCDKDYRYYFNFADNLMLGDELLTDKRLYEKIETIKEFKENINVYNIELDKDQTYFAENYLVHHYCKLCSGYANII